MSFKSIAAALTLSLASATLAHATSITGTIGLGGDGTYNLTTGQFTAGIADGTGYNAYVNATDKVTSDSLSNFTKFNAANFFDFNTKDLGAGATVFSTTENGATLIFVLTNMISSGSNSAGSGFVGSGILTESFFEGGSTDAPAMFSLDTNEGAGTVITFNTTAVTPEPSSLILLGTGAIGAAGMIRRKFLSKACV